MFAAFFSRHPVVEDTQSLGFQRREKTTCFFPHTRDFPCTNSARDEGVKETTRLEGTRQGRFNAATTATPFVSQPSSDTLPETIFTPPLYCLKLAPQISNGAGWTGEPGEFSTLTAAFVNDPTGACWLSWQLSSRSCLPGTFFLSSKAVFSSLEMASQLKKKKKRIKKSQIQFLPCCLLVAMS